MNRPRSIVVVAPSRLHFGLLGFGDLAKRQFGGAGVMVAEPQLELHARPAAAFGVEGSLEERIRQVAQQWQQSRGESALPRCRFEVRAAPPLHSGLGAGTQLALSVASALNALHGLPPPTVAELAASVARGLRSAVGTHGFAQGGLIAELGKLPDQRIAQLHERVPFPESWRLLLVTPGAADRGLSGAPERQAFDQLPPVEPAVTMRLQEILCRQLLPAVRSQDLASFSASLHEFGRLAGECFASIQGGAYNGPDLQRLVERIRSLGVHGVGQSSWGPTIFAVCADQAAAERLRGQLLQHGWASEAEIVITAADNRGARVHND